jgi:hypothetical protein
MNESLTHVWYYIEFTEITRATIVWQNYMCDFGTLKYSMFGFISDPVLSQCKVVSMFRKNIHISCVGSRNQCHWPLADLQLNKDIRFSWNHDGRQRSYKTVCACVCFWHAQMYHVWIHIWLILSCLHIKLLRFLLSLNLIIKKQFIF